MKNRQKEEEGEDGEEGSLREACVCENLNYEYNALMSSLQVSVSKHLLDEYYTMVSANDFYYKIIRYSKEEYEKKFHSRPDIYYAYHGYAAELEKVRQSVIEAVEARNPGYSVVTRMPVKGGGHVWVRMTGNFTREIIGGYPVSYTVITDINDLVQISQEQTLTYDNLPGFVAKFRLGENGRIELLEANDKFKEFFALSDIRDFSEEILRMNLDMNRDAVRSQMKKARAGGPVRFLSRLENRAGQTAWMQVSGGCVDRIGDDPVYLLIYIDVTDVVDLKNIQKRLEEQASQLKEALRAAEEANRAKSDFLSRMSHDIRTPMNAIVGMTEIAGGHLGEPERIKNYLKKISVSSQHLLGLINDVLDMSKIESGQMALREESMFLPVLTENVVSIIQPMIKERRQNFSVRIKNLVHERYFCDSLRLRQCFINILSNASKFTPPGGTILFDVEETPSADKGKADLTFVFTDTGIGIKPEFIARIFDAFAREKDGRIDKTEGSGLGMAITRKIVDLMGGTISVESEPGKGTVFTVRLSLRIDEQRAELPSLQGLKVLIADDDEVMCECTAETLGECGVETGCAVNGTEAVEKLRAAAACGEDYDAVILDWKMPELDGLETIRKIRGELNSKIVILVASAYDWTEIEEEALAAGVDGFLSKPLFRSTLGNGLYRYLSPAKEGRSPERDKSYDFSGKRILLAEDNELNREIAVELLSETGANVDSVGDGAACVRIFQAKPAGYYQLILMDVQMPVMDGYAATRAIRALLRPDAKSLPILAMTADVFTEDIAAAKAAGMNGHLAKPLDVEAMKEEISRLFRERDYC